MNVYNTVSLGVFNKERVMIEGAKDLQP